MIGRILVRGPLHNKEKQMWHDEIWASEDKNPSPGLFWTEPNAGAVLL